MDHDIIHRARLQWQQCTLIGAENFCKSKRGWLADGSRLGIQSTKNDQQGITQVLPLRHI